MKKRILSILLAVLMLVGILPISAMAATTDTPPTDTGAARRMSVSANSEDNAVHVTKSVSEDGKTLTLEAYATNTMTTVTTYEPLDIVLVLDVSGSMDDPMGRWDSTKRIDALKTAVKTFIDNVAKQKNGEKTVDHRISIVKFSGDMSTRPGNDTYQDGGYTYNYSQVVKPLTAVSKNGVVDGANVTALKDAVQALKPAGATRADNGMKLAQTVLNNRGTTTRRSVVVLFTDGTPSTYSSFDSDVASAAIGAAKTMKAGGTKIYTIGVFSGAKPSDDPTNDRTSDVNKYMHAMSSNYPTATYTSNYWGYSFDFGTREKNSNYYLSATNSTQLNSVFQTISGEIGSLKATVDKTSVLSDTLSEMFDFAPVNGEANKDAIKVKKVAVTGKENGEYTWADTGTDITSSVDVDVTGKKLTVTGFDYAANAVTEKTGGSYEGYKLVVTIPIKPDTNHDNWAAGRNYYDTNSTAEGKRAGLEYGEAGSRKKLELNDSPNAPVTAYTVTYNYENAPTNAPARPTDDKAYIEGQTVQVQSITPVPAEEDYRTHTFGGWTKDGAPAGDSFTMGNENVTLTGNWTSSEYEWTVKYQWAEGTPSAAPSAPTDGDVYKDEAAARAATKKNPSQTTFEDNNATWTFQGWDEGVVAEGSTTVTYTGTWTSANYEWNVEYVWAGNTPSAAPNLPADEGPFKDETEAKARATKPDQNSFEHENATWTFEGWGNGEVDPEHHTVTFTGTWTSEEYKWTVRYRWAVGTPSAAPNLPADEGPFKDADAAKKNAQKPTNFDTTIPVADYGE